MKISVWILVLSLGVLVTGCETVDLNRAGPYRYGPDFSETEKGLDRSPRTECSEAWGITTQPMCK